MRIGVFCSGGDAPGMNACVRGVVRSAVGRGHEVVGIKRGYQGLLDEDFFKNVDGEQKMLLRSVSNWSLYGGAFLRSSRSEEFRSPEGQRKAAEILRRREIDALIPIGGDGTLRGAVALAEYWKGQIVGCPGTIDNDLVGTDYTIGFSSAVQTAVEAVDKIRVTAESHQRMFLIEVMGRHSGYIAVYTAIGAGAEDVCIPETPTDVEQLVKGLHQVKDRGKTSVMMIVAEGDEFEGGVARLKADLDAAGSPFPIRTIVLGHLQRGGAPTPEDRLLGSQLGVWAVEAIEHGQNGVMVGRVGGQQRLTPFLETYASHRRIPVELLELLSVLSR